MESKGIAVGIVTIEDYMNYGNRLQNYALTKLLRNEGLSVLNGIYVYTKEDWINASNNQWKRLLKSLIPFSFIKSKFVPKKEYRNTIDLQREEKFREFTESYTTILDKPIIERTHTNAYKVLKGYGIDAFIVGSDQVWNPVYEGRAHEFLLFAPKEKRLSFAASIGVDEIPQSRKKVYQKALMEMRYISVRESKAAEIVKELTGRDADITLDPTLLLGKEEWDRIVKKPDIDIASNYICTYFLGEVPKAVDLFANDNGYTVYQLNSKEDEKLYQLSPEEFLYMIKNAECILTDSFHAVAFSIVFHKEFYAFRRKQKSVNSMFSRIENLLQRYNLTCRIQDRNRIEMQSPIDNWNVIDEDLTTEKIIV